jgi:RNA polymerase sigma-70 factor (ECF subfamily)
MMPTRGPMAPNIFKQRSGSIASITMADREALGDLISRCALRDQRAFAELYRHTSGKLYAVALRILRRRDWAEEALQESFINIWNHIGEYTPAKGAPMTWMMSIVRNRSLDWLRRSPPEHGLADYDLLVEALPHDGPAPEVLLGNSRAARALAECLKQLSASQRQSITLAYIYGLTHSELARHMREPVGTVKSWIRRGLAQLRPCLGFSSRNAGEADQ